MANEPKINNLEIVAWMGLADDDYIAARILLLNGLSVQGAICANTAIEKYLKMIHRIKGLEFKNKGNAGHDVVGLYQNLVQHGLKKDVNESFLRLLRKVYAMRYFDKLNENFNFALSRAKTLVCLDETVYKLRSGLKFTGVTRPFKFDMWVKEKYPLLMNFNHAFGDTKREFIFSVPSEWCEIRILKNSNWMECHYLAQTVDDGNYDLEGLQPGATDRDFKFQNAPLNSPNMTEKDTSKP